MKEVLITADDFGMCQIVDQAILDLIQGGMVTTTNVITNLETLSNGERLVKQYPHVSVGLHWNVTTGEPITKAEDVATLVDANGRFHPGDEFVHRMNKGLIKEQELKKELVNQFRLFEEVCGSADYWNVHENVVLSRKAYGIFAGVAQTLGMRKTRNFQRVYLDAEELHGKRKAREWLVRRYMDLWYGVWVKRTFAMPDGRIITFKDDSKTDLIRLIQALERSPKQKIELVIHPSSESTHPLFGGMSEQRLREYQFFKAPETVQAFQEHFKLVGFEVIHGKG